MRCLVNKYGSWPCPSWQILDEDTLGFIGPFLFSWFSCDHSTFRKLANGRTDQEWTWKPSMDEWGKWYICQLHSESSLTDILFSVVLPGFHSWHTKTIWDCQPRSVVFKVCGLMVTGGHQC